MNRVFVVIPQHHQARTTSTTPCRIVPVLPSFPAAHCSHVKFTDTKRMSTPSKVPLSLADCGHSTHINSVSALARR